MAKPNKNTFNLDDQIRKYKNELLRFQKMNRRLESQEVPQSNTREQQQETRNGQEDAQSPYASYRKYAEEHPRQGKLMVQTFTARRTYPVEGAVAEISKTFPTGKYVIATLTTDESGKTQEIILPTAQKILSEVPGQKQPYSTFDITITHPEYIGVRVKSVPVFQDVTAMQVIDLTPKSASPDGREFIEYTADQPFDL